MNYLAFSLLAIALLAIPLVTIFGPPDLLKLIRKYFARKKTTPQVSQRQYPVQTDALLTPIPQSAPLHHIPIHGTAARMKQPRTNPGYYCVFECMWCGCRQGCNNVSNCSNCGACHWTVRTVADKDNNWLPEMEDFMEVNKKGEYTGRVKRRVDNQVGDKPSQFPKTTWMPDQPTNGEQS